jgi:hypothetical protein
MKHSLGRRGRHASGFLCLCLLAPSLAWAQDASHEASGSAPPTVEAEPAGETRVRLYADVDPFAYLFKGYSVHAGVTPPALSRWRFGVGSVRANYPDLYVKLISPRNEGWKVREQLYSVLVMRSFSPDRRGWFAGLHSLYMRDRLSLAGGDERVHASRVELLPHGGYLYFPSSRHGFYLSAWAGLGLNLRLEDERPQIGDRVFYEPVLRPFATFHLGYEL